MTSISLTLGNHKIGDGAPCFVIAEAGVNHNGNTELAYRLIDAAKDVGADAVKFQTFRTDDVVTATAPKAQYQSRTTAKGESQRDMIAALELPADSYADLKKYAEDKGLVFLSTPFDPFSVDLLDEIGVVAFKIPSGEITNIQLLEHVASKGKPILISTGMSNLGEVDNAVRLVTARGLNEIALFQCTSNYPTAPKDVNLRAMATLAAKFGVPVGLSDHTEGWEIAIAAVALGATMIEKHLTLDCKMAGPDHAASMEPPEFTLMVNGIRKVEAAMGTGIKEPAQSEADVASVARRSLVAACDLAEGAVLSSKNISFRRPGTGLPPTSLPMLVGKILNKAVEKGHLFSMNDLAN